MLLQCKVGVGVGRVDVLFVEVQHFVVRDDTGVGKVVDANEALDGHGPRGRQHLVHDGHGVGNVDDLLVLDNLGDKVPVDQVVRDGHADTQNEGVGVGLEHRLDVTLGSAVPGSVKVGNVLLGEANARSERVRLIVGVDAAGGVHGQVDALGGGQVSNVEDSNDVRADRLGLVVLTPVNVGPSGDCVFKIMVAVKNVCERL